jgi:hypothetical protein
MSTPAAQVFDPRKNNADYFWYAAAVAGLSSVAPNGNALINLDADSYFYCVALTAVTNIAAAAYTESTAPLPLVTLQITDTATGKAMMNTPILIPGMTGDGKRPYRFVRPRVFQPNGTIQLQFASQVAAGTTYGIQVIFHGYKVYLGANG